MRSASGWAAIAAGLAMTSGFARLAEPGLHFLDSWCYARVSAEMAAGGDWVVPTWRGEPFLEKPPLLFWATAALFKVFGVSEFAAAAVAGASTAGCVLLVFCLGRRAAGPACGLIASLLLCATPMFLRWGRTYTTDPLFTLLNLAALACGWRAGPAPALWPLAGALAGLCVLTRGAATLPLALTLVFLAWRVAGEAGARRPRRAWQCAALLVFAGVALPWHLAADARAGPAFARTYLVEHTLERARENLIDSPRASDPLYYPGHLARTFWPSLPIAAWGMARLRRAWRPALDPAGCLDRALLVWLGSYGLLLAVVASRSPRYLLPVYPAVALLAARGLAHGLAGTGEECLRRWGAAAALLGALAVAVWPAPIGTARGAPFRILARAVARESGSAVSLQVDPSLIDPWFERAFWFYLGRAPVPAPVSRGAASGPATPPGGELGGEQGRILRVVPAAHANDCLPPSCRVLERAPPYALVGPPPPSY